MGPRLVLFHLEWPAGDWLNFCHLVGSNLDQTKWKIADLDHCSSSFPIIWRSRFRKSLDESSEKLQCLAHLHRGLISGSEPIVKLRQHGFSAGTVARSWYSHGTLMVLSWYSHLVLSWLRATWNSTNKRMPTSDCLLVCIMLYDLWSAFIEFFAT